MENEITFIDYMFFGTNITSPVTGVLRSGLLLVAGGLIHEFTRGHTLNAIGGRDLVKKRNIAAGKVVLEKEKSAAMSIEDAR